MPRRKTFAAIDVGSNEINMQIAELDGEAPPRILTTLQRTLPLGIDTYTTGSISQTLLDDCVLVLQGLLSEMAAYQVAEYRAVATSAFREAANSLIALDQIERRCGLRVDVLDNTQERAYHILSVATRMPDFAERIRQGTLIVDVGAGSIQVSAFDKSRFIFSQNMLLGSLRIRELLADLEQRTADFAGLMDAYISSDLNNYRLLEPKDITYKHLIILGGEMPYLKKLAGMDASETELSDERLEALYRLLLTVRPFDLATYNGIPVEHASLILPVTIILRKFIRFTGLRSLELPAAHLCDAIQIEFARQHYGYKPPHNLAEDLINACRHIARRYQVNQQHTALVERLALQLFDKTAKLHRLPKRSRQLLQAAVILHDIGKYVNMSQHHIHSRELILASEIIGLSRRETAVVAWTAGFHEGDLDMEAPDFASLSGQDRLEVAKLASLLRLANALDSSHQQKITDVEIHVDEQDLVIQIRTKQDIVLERWALEHHSPTFTRLFGIKPVIKIRGMRS